MPYPRYGQDRRNDYRRDDVSPWQTGNYPNNRGGFGGNGLLPTPNRGSGSADVSQLALAGNLLGSLLSAGGGASLASSLAMLQGSAGSSGLGMGGSPFGGGLNSNRSMADSRNFGRDGRPRGGRDRSPARRHHRARSRSRSPRRSRSGNDDRGRRSFKRSRDSPPRERAPHEIYIGNYPVRFREADVRKLFEDHGVKVTTIRLKHDGLKVFAFAETVSQEEVQKAVKAMDSNEINGRRLRVRSAADKDKKTLGSSAPPAAKKPRRELNVDDVTRHLAFAFVGFLNRQSEKEGTEEAKVAKINETKELINSIFDLPPQADDDSLKVSRPLELIFMQNNRREISLPEDDEDSSKKASELGEDEEAGEEAGDEAGEKALSVEDDDGNWKRGGKATRDEEEEEGEEEEEAAEEPGSEAEGEDGSNRCDEEDEQAVEETGLEAAEGDLISDDRAEEEEVTAEAESEAVVSDSDVKQEHEEEVEQGVPEIEEEAFPKPPVAVVTTPRGRGRGRRGRGRRNY